MPRLVIYAVICVLSPFVYAFAGAADTAPWWQADNQGPLLSGRDPGQSRTSLVPRAGGLTANVALAIKSRSSWRARDSEATGLGGKIMLHTRLCPFQSIAAYSGKSALPWDGEAYLGTLEIPGIEPEACDSPSASWASVLLEWGDPEKPHLRFWVSRLTPALLFEVNAMEFALFSGAEPDLFRHAAVGTSSGVRLYPNLPSGPAPLPLEDLASGWLLVWGKPSGKFLTLRPVPSPGRKGQTGFVLDANLGIPGAYPLLLVFSRAPSEISAVSGLWIKTKTEDDAAVEALLEEIGEADAPFRLAVLPLFGAVIPPADAVKGWDKGLPEEIAVRCDWWAQRLAHAPIDARETYSRDENTDTVVASVNIEYLEIREDGRKCAPVPPMLELARHYGFPIEFSGVVSHSGLATAWGPYAVIDDTDSYTYSMRGLGKYALERRAVKPGEADADLLALAGREVQQILDAGHLAPVWKGQNSFAGPYGGNVTRGMQAWMWGTAGEILYTLAEVLPLLGPEQRQRAIEYMLRERAEFPPESLTSLKTTEGARRERHPVRREDLARMESFMFRDTLDGCAYFANEVVPIEGIYHLARFHEATGAALDPGQWRAIQDAAKPWQRRYDWATLGWHTVPMNYYIPYRRWPTLRGGLYDTSCNFAAMIGLVRLARLAGDKATEIEAWGQLLRAAAARYGMACYANFLYDTGMIQPPADPEWPRKWFHREGGWVPMPVPWAGPEDDVRQVAGMDQFGVDFTSLNGYYMGHGLAGWRGMFPELGRFMADFFPQKAARWSEEISKEAPDWYLTAQQARWGSEFCYEDPIDSYTHFLLRAWVLGESAERLEKYIDIPYAARGDLYYLHKLAETAKAARGLDWVPAQY